MQTLCHYEVQGGALADALNALASEDTVDPGTLGYARTLCAHYERAGADVDARISAVLRDRKLESIDPVARNTARVAAIELIRRELPPKVAVNEAIEIARAYANDATAKFVNGLLDPLIDEARKDA